MTVEGVGAPRKPLPLMVSVCAVEPTVREGGDSDVIDGAGFWLMQVPAITCSVTALLTSIVVVFCANTTIVRGEVEQLGVSIQLLLGIELGVEVLKVLEFGD